MTTENIDKLADALSQLSVIDLAKLKTMLEDKWGVKASAPAMMMPMQVVGQAAAAEESKESTEFKVTLDATPADKKIGVIKVIREITGLGLKEAKDLVEGAPKVLKESVSKAEAEDISKKISTAGGKATLQGL